MKLTLAVIFFITGLALAIVACTGCAPDAKKTTPALTSGERGYAGTEADIDGVRRGLKMMYTLTGDPTLKALITSTDQAASDAQVKNAAVGVALQNAEKDAAAQQKRAETAEGNIMAASKARYDWSAIICVGVMLGSIVLRAYAPPVSTTAVGLLKGLTTALAAAAGVFFVMSLVTGIVSEVMPFIGIGLVVCMVFLTVFWAITHKKALAVKFAQMTNTVASVTTALSTVPADTARQIKAVMADEQTPDTRLAVNAIKATLPPITTTVTFPAVDPNSDPPPFVQT